MGDTRSGGYDPGPVMEALPELRRRGDGLRRRGWIEIAVVCLAALAVSAFIYFEALYPTWSAKRTLLICLIQLAAGAVIIPIISFSRRGVIRRRLATSGLFECLVLDRPRDHAPLWRVLRDHVGKSKPVQGLPPGERLGIAARRLSGLLFPGHVTDNPFAISCLGFFLLALVAVYSAMIWSAVADDDSKVELVTILLIIIHVSALVIYAMLAVRRLRIAWQHHLLAGYIADQHQGMLAGGTLRTAADISLHLRINDLEDCFAQGNARMLANLIATCLLSVIALSPGLGYISYLLREPSRNNDYVPLLVAAVVLLAVLCLIFIPRELALRRARRDAARLAGSYMLPQVLAGGTGEFNLQDAVPVMLRRNLAFPRMPNRYIKGLSEQLWLAGYNLDWFLDPGPRLVRPAWFAAPVLLVISLASLIVLPLLGLVGYLGVYSTTKLVLPVLAVACAGIYIYDVTRHRAWTQHLVRHLRGIAG